ncbi:MAG: GNAT family N-acetyltransferase [Bacteroidota bacterium]|jgi:GNAT superfamily N-acetyltransferase|nr:GNAT family N-acetyltransferase [Bacteroidota bacterium]
MQVDLSRINIREIGSEEVELLTSYRIAYLAEMQGERGLEYQQKLKSELNQYFNEALTEDRFFAFLAEQDGEALSFGAMVLKKIPGDFNQTSYLEGDILNMYTVPFARRKGISGMILQELLNEAHNRGISKVSLHTSKEGEKLYRKLGFTEPIYPVLELRL